MPSVRPVHDSFVLFSTPMVRALLDGRKTQTRRVISPQPDVVGRDGDDRPVAIAEGKQITCRYGYVGDRLWVRERWAYLNQFTDPRSRDPGPVVYAADASSANLRGRAWRMSRSMPRTASRIMLEVTSLRIEKINRITPEDARAEGFDPAAGIDDPLMWFRQLWDELNVERGQGWKTNPWVWVVGFQMLRQKSPALQAGAKR